MARTANMSRFGVGGAELGWDEYSGNILDIKSTWGGVVNVMSQHDFLSGGSPGLAGGTIFLTAGSDCASRSHLAARKMEGFMIRIYILQFSFPPSGSRAPGPGGHGCCGHRWWVVNGSVTNFGWVKGGSGPWGSWGRKKGENLITQRCVGRFG